MSRGRGLRLRLLATVIRSNATLAFAAERRVVRHTMRLQDHLGAPATLDAWLDRLGQFPGDGWLVIARKEKGLSLEMECRPITTSGRDLSGEEQEELDVLLEQSGWRRFLHDSQLEDVVENLRMQVRNPTKLQVLEAVRHYWKRDAFVELGDA